VRIESSVTSITWLPREALEGMPDVPLDVGAGAYDDPPPDILSGVDELRRAHRFREANELRAWIDVVDGAIVAYGHEAGDLPGPAELGVTPRQVVFPAIEFPVIQPEPDVGDGWVRFVQTVGGRVGTAMPRVLPGEPYPLITAASAWTTLELVIHADGRSHGRLLAASPYPRHWVYDAEGRVIEKREMSVDAWAPPGEPLVENTPWGSEDAPAFVATVASELEREITASVLTPGAALNRQRLAPGETLVEQGKPGQDVFVLLTGALDVEVDGTTVARVGAGAIVGERAVLEGGRRTATLRAVKHSCVGVIAPEQLDRAKLAELSASRE
jgi:hypothetical protein